MRFNILLMLKGRFKLNNNDSIVLITLTALAPDNFFSNARPATATNLLTQRAPDEPRIGNLHYGHV